MGISSTAISTSLTTPVARAALRGGADPTRTVCRRCRRPGSCCYCAHLAPIPSATRVVFLQHPRESKVAIGTCRMAHLALADSELHLGVSFEAHPRLRALVGEACGEVAVLYPGGDARDPETFERKLPHSLIVLDGTWRQVRTMWRVNPSLHRLPRIGFMPAAPGNYRIRREPAPHCLATVEAIVETLGRLEGDPDRFRPILGAFEQMVGTQLVYRALRPNAPWRREKRSRQRRPSEARRTLRARREDLVVVYAESNAHPIAAGETVPELVQLVAYRPATGARFAAFAAPRGTLAASTAHHLEVDGSRLHGGDAVRAVLARWDAFVGQGALVCMWGRYTNDLLRREGDPPRATLDLRDAMIRELGHTVGGMEAAAELMRGGVTPEPWMDGRAGRRIAALSAVVEHLATAAGADAHGLPASEVVQHPRDRIIALA
jgi:DTW domain-containing protein